MASGKDYYEILGVPRCATMCQIKRAYKVMALKYHPDKNHDDSALEIFQQVTEAYDVLSDPQKKEIFDKFGETGLKTGCCTHTPYSFTGDAREMFCNFFGDMFSDENFREIIMKARQGLCDEMFGLKKMDGKTQDPCVERDLPVAIDELFRGCTRRLKITRRIFNMFGDVSDTQQKMLSIDIQPGWKAGTKITFEREGDENPGRIPADIIFHVREKPHEHFRRCGNNLIYEAKITLKQALLGCEMAVPTIDGVTLPLKLPGIIKPCSHHRIPGYGMPLTRSPQQRGDLLVCFKIIFPAELPVECLEAVKHFPDE